MRVTDVVDMDVALHGKRFIVSEFAAVTFIAVAIAIFSSVPWFRVYAAFVAANCSTFAALAAVRPRRVAPSLKGIYWLTAYALALLFVPLYFPIAALVQRRSDGQALAR
jgi:hypothetical protein